MGYTHFVSYLETMGIDKVLLKFEFHNTFYGCLGCAESVFRNFTYNLVTGNMGKNKQYGHTLLFNKKKFRRERYSIFT